MPPTTVVMPATWNSSDTPGQMSITFFLFEVGSSMIALFKALIMAL